MSEENTCCTEAKQEITTPVREVEAPVFKPRYSSRYDEEAWEVQVMLPGVKKGDAHVSVENEILEVTAHRSFEVPDGWKVLGENQSNKRYQLRLDVGPEVDPARISAALDSGVLTLRLPLREEVKPVSITVS